MQEYLPKALPVNTSDASLVRIERGSFAYEVWFFAGAVTGTISGGMMR